MLVLFLFGDDKVGSARKDTARKDTRMKFGGNNDDD